MTRADRKGCEVPHIAKKFLTAWSSMAVSHAIPGEPDQFVKRIVALQQCRDLREESRYRERRPPILRGRRRDHRVADRPKGPQRSRHVPRMCDHQRAANTGTPEDFGRV